MAFSALSGQTVLVTGATGFVGSHVVERLSASGAQVRGLVRSAAKGAWLIERGATLAEGDLADAESLRRAAHGCSVVLSIAGWVGQPPSFEVARQINVDGTRALVKAAVEAGARRLVHTSSIAAYGPIGSGVVDETWPLNAADAYGATKAQSEAVVWEYADRIETSVIRPAQIYGPRSNTWTVALFEAVKRGLPILIDGGHGTFHPCYIENLVDAYLLAATRPEAAYEAFTVVDGTTTWREFVGHYARMLKRRTRSIPSGLVRVGVGLLMAWTKLARQAPPGTSDSLKFLLGSCRYSNEKAKRLLGWSPRVSLDEGMRRTEAWLREARRLV